jgi:hypothetical protein
MWDGGGMMNVRELKEKLRGLDDNLLVVIQDTDRAAYEEGEEGEKDAFDLLTTRVIELYPGVDALMLGADPDELLA